MHSCSTQLRPLTAAASSAGEGMHSRVDTRHWLSLVKNLSLVKSEVSSKVAPLWVKTVQK